MSDLDARMLKAHADNDTDRLVALYTQAADDAADIDAECFYLTHAYVFALEIGHTSQRVLRQRLMEHGREE